MMMPMFVGVIQSYTQRSTSGNIVPTDLISFPNVVICDNWVNQKKLTEQFPQLNSEYEREIDYYWPQQPWHNKMYAPICTVIQSFFGLDPYLGLSPQDIYYLLPDFQRRVYQVIEWLDLRLLNVTQTTNEESTKEGTSSLESFLFSIMNETKEFIFDVTVNGRSVDYSESQRIFTLMGGCYVLKINQSSIRSFDKDVAGGIAVRLRKDTHDGPCRRGKNGQRVFVFAADYKEAIRKGILDAVMLHAVRDYAISLKSYDIRQKSKTDRECNHNYQKPSNAINCFGECIFDGKCPNCEMFIPETGERFSNFTAGCHRFMNPTMNCVLAVSDAKRMAACEAKCPKDCEQVFFAAYPTSVPSVSDTAQTLYLKPSDRSASRIIEEFYVFDTTSFLCALGSLWSLFFGYSFVTMFTMAVEFAQKISCNFRK